MADKTAPRPEMIHPRIVRATHWLNAIAMAVMIGSGWQIYNAFPIFPFLFPRWMTVGGWLGGALLWHFAAMWLLTLNFALYVIYGVLSGRFRAKLLPIRPREIATDLLAALTGRMAHAQGAKYNAIQKALYLGVIGAVAVAILSGLALWKPTQLSWLTALFGGFQGARLGHFLAMAAIAGFSVIHVVMALLVPKSLRAMIVGR